MSHAEHENKRGRKSTCNAATHLRESALNMRNKALASLSQQPNLAPGPGTLDAAGGETRKVHRTQCSIPREQQRFYAVDCLHRSGSRQPQACLVLPALQAQGVAQSNCLAGFLFARRGATMAKDP
jgi:hypothetical protein